MTFPSWSGRVTALAAIALVFLVWQRTTGQTSDDPLNGRQDEHKMTRLTWHTKGVCVGRFLLDLPEEARVELSGLRVDGFDIAVADESSIDFHSRLTAREAQLRRIPDRLGGTMNLESANEVKNGAGISGKIFVHSRSVTEGQSSDGLTIERYRYEGVAVEALVHSGSISIDFSKEYADQNDASNLEKLIAQLVPNPEHRIPSEPAICLDRAYIRAPIGANLGEQSMLAAWLPSHPDIVFRIMLAAGTKPDEQGLLERTMQSNAQLLPEERQGVSSLRARPRTIRGLAGEEVIERFVEDDGSILYGFWWEVNGTINSALIPHIVFTMDTGNGKNRAGSSPSSQRAAIALWDKVLPSFRPLLPPES